MLKANTEDGFHYILYFQNQVTQKKTEADPLNTMRENPMDRLRRHRHHNT